MDLKELDGLDTLECMRRAELTLDEVTRLVDAGFMTQPASVKWHLNYPGGLALHCVHVVRNILKLTPVLGVAWELERSPYRIGILHDMVKCHCYSVDASGAVSYARHRLENEAHGIASLKYAVADVFAGDESALNAQERAGILHHMGAYGLDRTQLQYFGNAKREMPREILCVHWADDMAATIDEA